MESTRPIRALTRGLDALTVLNMRGGATVSEIAQQIRLPRTTVYRILETLCVSGFAFRDDIDERYRVTPLVCGLSVGFEDEPWVSQGAKSLLLELGREIAWPISIATLSGFTLMIRASTDHTTPLAIERLSAGMRLPLVSSAAGRAYLAFCAVPQRESLIDAALAQTPRGDLQRALADVRSNGYATVTRARHPADEVSLAVPVMTGDRVLGALTVRFIPSSGPVTAAIERFLPGLRHCAVRISDSFLERQAAARASGAPVAAA